MHFTEFEFASVDGRIHKIHLTIPVLFAIHELPAVDFAVFVCFDPLAVGSVVPPLAFVETPVGPAELSIAVGHVSLQISGVGAQFRDQNRGVSRFYFPVGFKIWVV